MNINKSIKIIFFILIIAILIVGCKSTGETIKTTDKPIKLGAILQLTGSGAAWGENAQKGATLAIEEINQQGGILGKQLEITFEDDQTNAKAAVSALRKLNSQNIKLILGPSWSRQGLATAPIACQEEVVMISPSLGVAEFNEACDFLFNLWPHDAELSKTLGKNIFEQGFRKIAILGSLEVWEMEQANAVKRGFEEAGGEVVVFELVQAEQKEFRTEAAKIKASDAEAVVLTNYAFMHLAAKQIKGMNIDLPFFAVLIDEDRITGAEGAFEGTVVITAFTPNESFVEKFRAKYGTQPDIGADTSYDVVKLFVAAIKNTDSTDPVKVKEYLNSLKKVNGASGKLTFDNQGSVTKEVQFKEVKNNKLV